MELREFKKELFNSRNIIRFYSDKYVLDKLSLIDTLEYQKVTNVTVNPKGDIYISGKLFAVSSLGVNDLDINGLKSYLEGNYKNNLWLDGYKHVLTLDEIISSWISSELKNFRVMFYGDIYIANTMIYKIVGTELHKYLRED